MRIICKNDSTLLSVLVKLGVIVPIIFVLIAFIYFLLSLFPKNIPTSISYKEIGEFNQKIKECYSITRVDPNSNDDLFQLCLQDKECAECLDEACTEYNMHPSPGNNYKLGNRNEEDCFIEVTK